MIQTKDGITFDASPTSRQKAINEAMSASMNDDQLKPSQTCGVMISGTTDETAVFCGAPTTHAYPAMGGGYMALCREHSRKHTEAWPIQEI